MTSSNGNPTRPRLILEFIPEEMRARRQWVVWRYEIRKGKKTKVLYTPGSTGRAKSNDPRTWRTFPEAIAAYEEDVEPSIQYDGIGYVFAADDPFFGGDLDACLKDGVVLEWAIPFVEKLKPTYGEISPSETGIKFIGRGKLPGDTGTNKRGLGPDGKGALELYEWGRYFAITGNRYGDSSDIVDLSDVVAELYRWAKDKPKPKPRANGRAYSQPAAGVVHSDDEVLRAAGYSKGFDALYRGDQSGFPSPSEADFALVNRLTFYCGPNQEDQVERLFLASKLGERDKAGRADYVARTVNNAYAGRTEYFGWAPLRSAQSGGNGSVIHRQQDGEGSSSPFLVGKDRKPISCLTNTIKFLGLLRGVGPIRYNTFRREILVGDDQQPMSDQVIIALTARVELAAAIAWSQDHVKSALIHVSDENKFSSLVEWLDGLRWDEVNRIEHFFPDHFESEDTEYAREVGRTFFLGAVARAYKPGCKLDTIPLLMGNQGIGKSTGMAYLCPDPEWFCDELGGDLGSKAAAEGLAGKWIIELAELDAMRRSELETVKSFITRQSDRYRIPYAKTSSDFPRTVAFFGTTNSRTPLEDLENRRFLPIAVRAPEGAKTIDFDAIKAARDQLWAEAVRRFKADEKWWTTSPHLVVPTSEQAENARRVDAWEEILEDRMGALPEITTQGAASLLGISPDKLDKSSQTRIGFCLAKLGWVRGTKPKGGGPRVYTRPHVEEKS